MTLQAFIINRNRLTTTRDMVEWLSRFDVDTVIFDNDSTYPPLLEWYRAAPANVIRFNENFGFGVGWDTGILGKLARGHFVLTDSDLDLSGVPDDWEGLLRRGLAVHGRSKAGFSIEIGDLPDHYCFKNRVVEWESQFWQRRLDEHFYDASIDTTFALYRLAAAGARPGLDAVRSGRPYTARHVPWYINVDDLSAEESYYARHATGSSSWTSQVRAFLSPPGPLDGRRPLKYLAKIHHRHWAGNVHLFEDGRLLAQHNGDTGAWLLDRDALTLCWDNWPTEVATTLDGRTFRNEAFSCELVEMKTASPALCDEPVPAHAGETAPAQGAAARRRRPGRRRNAGTAVPR